MRIAWITDLHLNASHGAELDPTIYELQRSQPDLLLSAGDLIDGFSFARCLEELQSEVDCPIYFVLGNHECYGSSIQSARRRACQLHEQHPDLHYLTVKGVVPLTSETCLIGHDAWADARAGDYLSSNVVVTDVMTIEEFIGLEPEERQEVLQRLGQEAADYFEHYLPEAFGNYHEILVLTHVPPFAEASVPENHQPDDNWSPHLVCQAVGEVLRRFALRYPAHMVTVFCGHSHHANDVQILPNLRCVTGFGGPYTIEVRPDTGVLSRE